MTSSDLLLCLETYHLSFLLVSYWWRIYLMTFTNKLNSEIKIIKNKDYFRHTNNATAWSQIRKFEILWLLQQRSSLRLTTKIKINLEKFVFSALCPDFQLIPLKAVQCGASTTGKSMCRLCSVHFSLRRCV